MLQHPASLARGWSWAVFSSTVERFVLNSAVSLLI